MPPIAWILGAVLLVVGIVAVVAVSRMSASRRTGEADAIVAELRREFDGQRAMLDGRNSAVVRDAVETVVTLAQERLSTETATSRAMLAERDRTVDEHAVRMATELEKVRGLVAELDRERSRGMGDLERRLTEASAATSDLSRTTTALKEALAASPTRGQWGERMAEDVLRSAGFRKGINYLAQQSTSRGRPDFTFLLPADRHLHMDVKFPLANYLRHLEATSDVEAQLSLKAFVRDARNRVRELARRDYIDPEDGSLDQVLLFLPNEHVYAFLHESAPTLLDEALAARVVLCSPVTLFAVLAVIRQAVDDHMTERRSREILDALNGFGEQWDKFTDHLDKVGERISSAQKAFDTVNGVRRRQLEKRLDAVEDLRRDELSAEVLSLALPPGSDDSNRSQDNQAAS